MSQNMIHYHLIDFSQRNAQIGSVRTCTTL
ncbi:hypothetical protein F383_17555 [Gossypium arboreum]|uniref:Uncharacterized protein n=1 Tax=Gossypium arboreum TaxID=29729 RepID=A0A0B0MIN7_GOSAR|nr:hypothetical protein F383_37979 [Gossypium arboreum]KHG14710.1 hypothetical protein F383_17555 [Gossypium arboreum]